jgi:hypothetical protein
MPLHPPKRTPAGYFIASEPPIAAPEAVAWTTEGAWAAPSPTWATWAGTTRQTLLGELLSHGTWFSRPPRREILEPLFGPWAGQTSAAAPLKFFCKIPEVPGSPGTTGRATWGLQGVLMTSTSIDPVWTLLDVTEDEREDCISLFGDAETAEALSDRGEEDSGTREIQLEEIEAAPAGTPTRIRNREWEARKFLAKERVREARLKAQIADHMAAKEEARFYRLYGELSDDESRFSEYDLTEGERSGSDSPGSDEDAVEHV